MGNSYRFISENDNLLYFSLIHDRFHVNTQHKFNDAPEIKQT